MEHDFGGTVHLDQRAQTSAFPILCHCHIPRKTMAEKTYPPWFGNTNLLLSTWIQADRKQASHEPLGSCNSLPNTNKVHLLYLCIKLTY